MKLTLSARRGEGRTVVTILRCRNCPMQRHREASALYFKGEARLDLEETSPTDTMTPSLFKKEQVHGRQREKGSDRTSNRSFQRDQPDGGDLNWLEKATWIEPVPSGMADVPA